MKTLKEWIEICKKTHPLIGERWENNVMKEAPFGDNQEFHSMDSALFLCDIGNYGFIWSSSPEGHEYWKMIYNDMEDFPEKYLPSKRKLFNPS
jgi:hypothetical protein